MSLHIQANTFVEYAFFGGRTSIIFFELKKNSKNSLRRATFVPSRAARGEARPIGLLQASRAVVVNGVV